MNTVNQVFNWSRFTAALRKELVESKHGILITLLSIYGLLTMIMIIGNLIMSTQLAFETMKAHYPTVFVVLSFTVCIAASLSFKKLTNKKGRIDIFTSPSSTLEKFTVNALVYVLGFFVAFFICTQLADLTRIAVLWFFKDTLDIYVPGPINFLNVLTSPFSIGDEEPFSQGLSIILPLSLIASGGLFLMGSVLWPRLSVLKTFAALFGFQLVLFILGTLGVAILGKSTFSEFLYKLTKVLAGAEFNYWSIAWYVIQILLFWGLGWLLFKRKDVISTKWWK